MKDGDFKMPPLKSQITTALQINTLRLVRITAETSCNILVKEEARLRCMIVDGDDNHVFLFFSDNIRNEGYNDNSHGRFLCYTLSLAKTIIEKYGVLNGKTILSLPCQTRPGGK